MTHAAAADATPAARAAGAVAPAGAHPGGGGLAVARACAAHAVACAAHGCCRLASSQSARGSSVGRPALALTASASVVHVEPVGRGGAHDTACGDTLPSGAHGTPPLRC